jgi:hypothetical protein
MLLLLICLALDGCGAVQKATVHTPFVAGGVDSTGPYADGIAVATSDLCFAIKESPASADYNNLAAGPLGLPIFPLGVVDPATRDSETFVFYLVIEPKLEGLAVSANELRLTFPHGEIYAPKSVRLMPGRIHSDPVPIARRTTFEVTFEKPAKEISPTSLRLYGVYRNGQVVAIPEIMFKRETKVRMVFSGQSIDGSTLSSERVSICDVAARSR